MAATDRKRRPKVTDPRADERRRSLAIKLGATVVVVVIAVAIGVWLIMTKKDDSPSVASSSSTTPPSVVTDTGAFRVAKGVAPKATLTITEDFQCPACKALESEFGGALRKIRSNPQVAVDYQPVAILDRLSSTNYSTRSANASACVAEATAGGGDFSVWLAYHDALYAEQPPEQSPGLTDEQLSNIADEAGAPASVSTCIDDGTYSGWVTANTEKAAQNGLQSTPQVELDGKVVALSTPQALITAVDAAVAS